MQRLHSKRWPNTIAWNRTVEAISKPAIVGLPWAMGQQCVEFLARLPLFLTNYQEPHCLAESDVEKEIHSNFAREVKQYVHHFTGTTTATLPTIHSANLLPYCCQCQRSYGCQI
jgi:hypothetical protein